MSHLPLKVLASLLRSQATSSFGTMLSLYYVIAICSFASASHIWENNASRIIQHVGEPVGNEQVHDGGVSYKVITIQWL